MAKFTYNVKINGVEQMIKNLNKIDSDIRNEVARDAVHEGATVIMGKAVMNAPVKKGTLRNSFRVESQTTATGAVAEVGPHVAYDCIQELGGWTGKGHKSYIKGKFYLGRAVESTEGEVSKVMADAIKDYLNKK